MEIVIKWSELSEKQLKEIFDYYSLEASTRVARKIINKILTKVSVLETFPLVGVKESLLYNYPEDFRFLVESNYKIIYWNEGDLVTIASIFDCRQNPDKITEL